jgi:tetratricopeptide (TPR) repeat protein
MAVGARGARSVSGVWVALAALLSFQSVGLAADREGSLAKARLEIRGKRYEQAIVEAKRSLSFDERFVPAMVVLARAYYELKKLELAQSILDVARKNDDKNADVYQLLGFILLARDDKAAATDAFRRATDARPNFAEAWNNLAVQYLAAKNYEEAKRAGERAVSVVPAFAEAHVNLGSALRGLGDVGGAEKEYRMALSLRDLPNAHFDLGILYLDAQQVAGVDTLERLDRAVVELTRYKQRMGARLAKDDPVDSYIEDARKATERERKRLERAKRSQSETKGGAGSSDDSVKGAPSRNTP